MPLLKAVADFKELFPTLKPRWAAQRKEYSNVEYLVHCCPARLAHQVEATWASELPGYDPHAVYCWKAGVQFGDVLISIRRLNAFNGHDSIN